MENSSASLVVLLITTTIITGLVIYAIYCIYKLAVLHDSKMYTSVKNKQKYYLSHINQMSLTMSLTSKKQFDRFDAQTYLGSDVFEWYEKAKQNLDFIHDIIKYKEQIMKKMSSDSFRSKIVRTECIKVLNNVQKGIPTALTLNYGYTTPAGRKQYNNSIIIPIDTLELYCNGYNKFQHSKAFAKHQRSLVSSELRYQVIKRDGGKCVLCGRTAADGIKLHVDHIKPVSKGGRTTLSNLRTLCEDCNRGKSDSYDEGGFN